jgi:hypothetical protein
MSKIGNPCKVQPILLNTTVVTKDAKIRLTKQDLLRSCMNYRGPLNNPVTPVGYATRSFWITCLSIGSISFVNILAPGNASMWHGTTTRRNVDITLSNKTNTNISQGVIHFKSSSNIKYWILKLLHVTRNRAEMNDADFGIIRSCFTFIVV